MTRNCRWLSPSEIGTIQSTSGRAIEGEWWDGAGSNWGNTRYGFNYANFHRLRLYARGEQSIQKYKDELAINGDLSYLNIDWKPIPVIPKFVDIVVNGMSQRNHEIKAYSQDPGSIRAKTQFASNVMQDMQQLLDKGVRKLKLYGICRGRRQD